MHPWAMNDNDFYENRDFQMAWKFVIAVDKPTEKTYAEVTIIEEKLQNA